MKFFLHLDENTAKRLEAFNRLTGAPARGPRGNKSAIIRWLIDKHLPSLEEMDEQIKYRHASGWQRQKMTKPQQVAQVEEFKHDRSN